MNEGAKELSRAVKEEEKQRVIAHVLEMKSFLLALHLMFICLQKQEDRHACRIGAGQVTVSNRGGGHSHIGSYQGCAARMGEFSGPKTPGWV